MTDTAKIELIAQIINLIVVPLIGAAAAYLVKHLNAEIKNAKVKRAISMAEQAMTQAVAETAQVYTDNLKRSGSLSKEAIKRANERTLTTVKSIISEKSYKYLTETFADVDEYLKSLMEYYVRLDRYRLPSNKDQAPNTGA